MKLSKKHDPTHTATRVNSAQAQMRRRMRELAKACQDYVLGMSRMEVNKEYSFETDPFIMTRVRQDIQDLAGSYLLEGDWLVAEYVQPTYAAGTIQAAATLGAQTKIYSNPPMNAVTTPIYQARVALVKARTFEEMLGFTDLVSGKVRDILGRAILDGLNPLQVAQDIANAVNGELWRGERIARTEITSALRRGRMDEAEEASASTGMRVMLMHISGFAPTSRPHHMARHGTLHTIPAQRLWWSVDANSINCLCNTIEVFVDDDGEPLAPGMLKRAQQIKDKYEAKKA